MEEEPTAVAPDLEAEKEFIIKTDKPERTETASSHTSAASTGKPEGADLTDEFDLSDITHAPVELSREEIIAAAEAAAYNE